VNLRAASAHAVGVLLLAAALALPLSGCAVLGMFDEGHEGGTATLSGAARAASDSSRKVRPQDVGHTTPPSGPEISVGGETAEGGESLAPAGGLSVGRPYERTHPLFGLVFEGGAFTGSQYRGFGGAGLSIGGYASERTRVDLVGMASSVDFTEQSLLGHAFKNGLDMKLELLARYEWGDPHRLPGFAPIAAIGTGTLFWDYAAPLTITENNVLRSVTDDRINHFYAYAGCAVTVARARHFVLDGRLVGGGRFYGWHTANGFGNDLLAPVGFAQFQVGAAFR
jgi:hypothetical protein